MKDTIRPIAALAGLWAVALAQPLLDALRRAPEFFVAHRADTLDTILVALGVTFAVPAAVAAILVAARAVSRALFDASVAVLVGLLAALVAVQVAYRLGFGGSGTAAVVAIAVAGSCAVLWRRLEPFRTFLTVLSPAALVVPAIFLGGALDASASGGSAQTVASATTARATPVVLMVFDELSLVTLMDAGGRLNAERFPQMAALAADGIWFRNATAVSDYTRWALPAIVTGRYPAARSTPTPRDHPNTVFSLLGRSHRLEVSEAVTMLCPRQLCRDVETPRRRRLAAMGGDILVVAAHIVLPPAARAGLPDLTQNWAGFAAPGAGDAGADAGGDVSDDESGDGAQGGPRVIRATRDWQRIWHSSRGSDHVGAAEQFIDGVTADDRQPTLYFIHTLASHRPSRWLPSGQEIAGVRDIPGWSDGRWPDNEWLVAQHHHADIMQAGVADTLVGRMRDRLKAAGIYDDALVIVTADHGVSMRAGDRARSYTSTNAAEVMPVPLIVKPPASMADVARGSVDDTNAETIDVLPTIAGVLGVRVPWPADGRALVGAADPPRPEKRFFYNAASRTATLKPDELWARRDEAARRQASIFGVARWPAFTIPGFESLVGRDVASFANIAPADDVRMIVEGTDALEHVNPRGRELPAELVGRFARSDAPAAAHLVVAVALNGRIVATTRVWPDSLQWMVMLPPDDLRAGSNDVEVFVVDPAHPADIRRPRQ